MEKGYIMKKNGVVQIAICILLIIATLAVLTSCAKKGNDTGVFAYNVAFAESYDEANVPFNLSFMGGKDVPEKDLNIILRTKQELIDFCSEQNLSFYDKNDANYNSKLSKKIRDYNEDYFNKNSLILIINFGKKYASARIEDIKIEDNVVSITFVKPDIEYETENLTTFAYIVEVNKNDVKMANGIKLKSISNGTIYSLKLAYEQGFISANEVKSIAHYHHNGKFYVEGEGFKETDYQPITKNPQEIDVKTQEKITQTFADYIYSAGYPFAKKEDFIVSDYYGTYNGYVAIKIHSKIELAVMGISGTQIIADTVIYYADASKLILLWKEGK